MEIQQFAMIVVLAVVCGALLGFATIFFRRSERAVLRRPDHLRSETPLPSVGSIPTFDPTTGSSLITTARPDDGMVHRYRLLAAKVQAIGHRSVSDTKTILITSPQPGDGKTTTVANLAVALAQTGKSVIAVDANFVHPHLHAVFGLTNSRGVMDVLRDGLTTAVDSYLQPTSIEGVQVLQAGSFDLDAPALVASPRMAQLLAELRRRGDVILIDGSALIESPPGAALLADHVDGTVMIVDATRTTMQLLRTAQMLLPRTSMIIGSVLNKVTEQDKR